MGIDRIGKGGLPPTDAGPGAVEGVEKKRAVEEAFSVEGPAPAGAASETAAIDPASPLARLRRGEIDVNGYVDLKVDEATHGIEGLSRAELHDIRKVLRDQLSTDPGLQDLVRQAAGKFPDVPED